MRWVIGGTDLKAPKSVPERKEFIAKAEDWWERNKGRSHEDWDTDEIANLFSTGKDKASEILIKYGDIMVDPALQKFDDPNNSPLAVFREFRAALLADDLDKVISCFASYRRAEYAEFYKKLRPYFRMMAEDMKGLVLESRRHNIVECDLLRQQGDSVFAFPITFVKDEDGNWRIQEL